MLRRFHAGEPAVLEDVYRAYVDSVARCLALALLRYGRPARKEGRGAPLIATELPDMVREVFARAFQPKVRRRCVGLRDFGPQLTAIARHVTVRHLHRTRRLLAIDAVLVVDAVSLSPATQEWPRDVDDLDLVTRVARFVTGLPPELRRAHELLYLHGLSQRDAAAALGVPGDVVPALAARLRQELRAALAPVTASDTRRDNAQVN
jgi:DNA-directed RNA polymerase specialized sigma24 family protein